MRRILLLPIIFALFLFPCLSQQPNNQVPVVVEAKPFEVKDYEGWQKVELKALTFYLPSYLKRKEVRCYDGGCYRFESDDLVFSIDLDPAAGRPTFEKSHLSYLSKYTQIIASMIRFGFLSAKGSININQALISGMKKVKNGRLNYLYLQNQMIRNN